MARTARENVREQILAAAEKRLLHFGYKKTTIDEIAADAGVGKGTVYLHFTSKEDIYCAIVAQMKELTLAEQTEVASRCDLGSIEKLRRFLKLPVLAASAICDQSPQAMEMVAAIRPHLVDRLQPQIVREAELLSGILREGNERGEFSVADPERAAKSLKLMTLCFMPPYPHSKAGDNVNEEIDRIVDLAYKGLRPAGRESA